jgi:cell division septal protein FtsQ
MPQLIDKKNRITVYLIFFIILSTISNKAIENKKNYLDKFIKIDVSGLSNNKNLLIKKKLNELLFRNIFFIRKDSINNVITQFNLVEHYSVTKIYPKKINIKIESTNFIARIKGSREFLVGSNGKLISNEYTDKVLPFIFGKFDTKKFLEFKKILESSEFKLSDFKSIFFYPHGRWDLQTAGDILIRLPEKDLSKKLSIAHKIINNNHFKENKTIDLRISNHIITKK